MRLFPRSLKCRAILLTLWALMGFSGTVWYQFGRDIKRYVGRQVVVLRLRDSEDAVVRGLARGDIHVGSSVEELIASRPPKRVTRHGRFVDVAYGMGPDLIAVDGKLMFAKLGSCSHATIFFDRLTPLHEQEYEISFAVDLDRRMEERKDAHRAVGGVIGWASCWSPYREFATPLEPEPINDTP